MWTHEHSTETDLTPQQIWRVLADIDDWMTWDTSMERISLDGPFAVGARVVMTPVGQEPIESVITAIEPEALYSDETTFNGLTLRFSHALVRLRDGGTRITHRLEITGGNVDEVGGDVGPMITADFPEAMAALIARAREVAAGAVR